jgi:N-acetylglucosaminyldiphosphoundecaprenol N-acetyl-beta-D-mannosaminyltransferase
MNAKSPCREHAFPALASPSAPPRPPIAIMGVPFDNVTTAEAVEAIEQMVASGQPHYLVTANLDFLVQARQDVELRRILFDAHLVLCDGMPLVWASRLLGNPLPERVAGADLVPLLIRVAAEKGHRLFFLGATPESASQAVANLQAQYPGLVIAGHYSPPFNKLLEMDHEEIRSRIWRAMPDLLFVCFGCPKQEKWIAMHYPTLGVPVTAGVGATIDFIAGGVRRAPLWMQRSGTEWLFRLAQEPRRLFCRYFRDMWVFGWSFLRQYWYLQFRRKPSPPLVGLKTPGPSNGTGQTITLSLACHCVQAPEHLDVAAVRTLASWVDEIITAQRHCLIAMDRVTFLDSTGIGLLIRLRKRLNATGRHFILIAPSRVVRRALALLHLQDFFEVVPDQQSAELLIAARALESCASSSPAAVPGNGAILWQGEITAANAAEVWNRTLACFSALPDYKTWTIDLSGVRFLDSTGLGVMVRAGKLAQQTHRNVAFTGIPPAVGNVIRIAGLSEFLLSPKTKG